MAAREPRGLRRRHGEPPVQTPVVTAFPAPTRDFDDDGVVDEDDAEPWNAAAN
jgi:hypothetical protein